MKRTLVITALAMAWLSASSFAQRAPLPAKTLLVLPFQNSSKVPGLDWIGESFPEVLGQRITGVFVIDRQDRLNAFDRMGLPASLRPSHATVYEIAQAMDVDYVVLGSYSYDGKSLSARAQVLDMQKLHLSQPVIASGSLPSLIEIETLVAWDLMHIIAPDLKASRNEFLSAQTGLRLDAFENYMRGLIATSRQDKIVRFREAVRFNPAYTQAILQLGKTYYEARDYAAAASWLERIPKSDARAREASFYLGISAYYLGQYEKAENAFEFVAARLPLNEVYNNMGVVAGRRGSRTAAEYFQKAVAADPRDPDYRFNLAVALARNGDLAGAARQLREVPALRPDPEAKSLLEALNRPSAIAGTAASPAAVRSAELKLPLERIKRNYDEASFRQLAFELENLSEMKLANKPPREHAQFHVERGRDLLDQGFVGEAEKQFKEAVVLDPANSAAHLGIAEVLARDGDLAKAREEIGAALILRPSPEVYLLLAQLDLRENNNDAAREDVERALLLEPANAAAVAMKRDIASRLAQKTQPATR